jgi:O-succinylbenzoic acid--CoA ligase
MERPLAYLKQRAGEDWLIGYDTNQFNRLTEELFQQLIQLSKRGTPPKILLAEQNPWRFLAAFLAAVAADCPVFLCNPNWVQQEWQQVFELVQPDLIFGQAANPNLPLPPSPSLPLSHSGLIMIPTGGSSGKIRFAIHTWETLMASVRGFHKYFGEKPVNSFCVLPLYHVSGLMQFLRSLITGGQIVILPFKALAAGEGRNIDPREFFISLVPTQLARLINSDSSVCPPLRRGAGGDRDVVPQNRDDISPTSTWLSRFRAVLLGGAPTWESLLEQARRHNIRLAPTYGMTETASQIVTLKPEDFLSGNNSNGQVLPHAQVTIRSSTGEILGANQTGIVTIQADSLALGYYPEGRWGHGKNLSNLKIAGGAGEAGKAGEAGRGNTFSFFLGARQRMASNPKSQSSICDRQRATQNLKSDDLGFFDEQGYLTIIGRCSNKIITGGENVFPAEVEAAIQATQLVADVCVTGIPDSQWGQAVTAIYVPRTEAASTELLQTAIEEKLSKYKRPKYWVSVESLPRNSQGKVNSDQLQKIVIAWLESQKESSQQLG